MTTPQAFQGDYTGLRFVNTRKVAQVVIEIPLEQATAFVAAFGTPDPANGVPLAIARINTEAKPEPTKRKWDELSIAQQAGIMCNEKGFQTFVKEKSPHFEATTEDAAQYVRQLCGVNSRANIEGKPDAERKFRALRVEYDNWLRVPV